MGRLSSPVQTPIEAAPVVAAGTLTGDAGSLQGDIVNDAALIFDQSSDAAFRGTLFGTGTMTKSGNGTLMLSGAHSFQGATRVESGTLGLDGTLAGSVDVVERCSIQRERRNRRRLERQRIRKH